MRNEAQAEAVSGNFVQQIIKGAVYPFDAFMFLHRNRLWAMATASIVINIVLLGALIAGTYYGLVPYVETMHNNMVNWAGDSTILGFFVETLDIVLWVLLVPAVVTINMVVLLLVGQAVASPFLDTLSEQVEALVLRDTPDPVTIARVVRSVMISLGDLVWGLLLLAAVNLPLLILGIIPIVGTGLAALISLGFSALLFAHEFFGLPLTRQLMSYRQRWNHVWEQKWLCLGLGTSTMVIWAVPGLNLLLLPLVTVGGTLLYCDLRKAGRV